MPYGYTSDRGILAPVEPEASAVQLIFKLRTRNALSLRQIATKLNEDGIPPRRSAKWSPSTVNSILGNVVYAGERYGKKSAHLALVTRRLWNDAQGR